MNCSFGIRYHPVDSKSFIFKDFFEIFLVLRFTMSDLVAKSGKFTFDQFWWILNTVCRDL